MCCVRKLLAKTMKTRTLDNSTAAALPSSLSLSQKKYANYFRKRPSTVTLAASLPWVARHFPVIGKHVAHWTQIREHLENGCLNPAKIICAKDGLVAAFTSLTAIGEETNPVIKVWRERVDLIQADKAQDGVRFAAASTYYRTNESWERGCWSDIEPYIVNCLVENELECEAAKGRLKPLAWEALDIGLQNLEEIKEGIHIVDVPHDIVWNAY